MKSVYKVTWKGSKAVDGSYWATPTEQEKLFSTGRSAKNFRKFIVNAREVLGIEGFIRPTIEKIPVLQ